MGKAAGTWGRRLGIAGMLGMGYYTYISLGKEVGIGEVENLV